MNVTALRCNHCHDIVYSRSYRDYRSCRCGKTEAQGWDDDEVRRWKGGDAEVINLELPDGVTMDSLYDDWKNFGTQYGYLGPDDYNQVNSLPEDGNDDV